ncbi:unnamed protein product [Echinostoma caproni]|uniref:HECT domain-containing protein n=1 Tax=Echinostoma caproni TaxID=27848 RepID=A0A183ADQ6_9TREM|nr:unnamed protein product [Echinostoma caproni]
MSSDDVFNGFDRLDSSGTGNPSDVLDFLNSSDNENELTDPPKVLENSAADKTSEDESANEDAPSLTLSITNVVVMASMRCHLRLKEIARSSVDVEYKALQNLANVIDSCGIAQVGVLLREASLPTYDTSSSPFVHSVQVIASMPMDWWIDPPLLLVYLIVIIKPLIRFPLYYSHMWAGTPFFSSFIALGECCSVHCFCRARSAQSYPCLIKRVGSSLDTISALVEELVPLAALHQTDEPVSDSDADEEQQKAEMRAATAAARQMVFLPEGLPLDELGLIEDEDEDPDADDYASDSDGSSVNASSRYRSGMPYSTDDSTDSGASIDSGGMSTRPKRRRKRRTIAATAHSSYTQSLGSILGSKSSQNCSNASPLHLMTAREAASLAFAKRASGDLIGARGLVAAAAEVRRQHELGELPLSGASTVASTEATSGSTVYSDPTWSRKAVASGSTKRACVVTYSGTEDSGAESAENMLSQSPQSNIMSISPNIPTTTQFVNFNPLPNAQTYQVYQPNMFISSPAVFSTNGAPMQPGTATIFSGGNGGVFFSGMPAGLGPALCDSQK